MTHTQTTTQPEIIPMLKEELSKEKSPMEISYSFADTPFGEILIASTHKGICALVFVDDSRQAIADLQAFYPRAHCTGQALPLHREVMNFFSPKEFASHPPVLHVEGTPFQMCVWEELLKIPFGKQTTYADIARRIGSPKAARAVGNAVGSNKISLLIPCHRVVASSANGTGGYRWGIDRKTELLRWEAEDEENE